MAEYRRSDQPSDDGSLAAGGGKKLHIDRERLDLGVETARRSPWAERAPRRLGHPLSGPRPRSWASFAHLFPDKVARGVVVPFGAYHAHYRSGPGGGAEGRSPARRTSPSPARPLPGFVERTYRAFFDEMIPAGTAEQELNAWIEPRLAVMRHSIQQRPHGLPPCASRSAPQLERQGLLR